MTDLLQDIEAYFISKGLAPMIYRDTMPSMPDSTVAVYEYEGRNGLPQVAGVLRNIQVVARDKNATQAKEKARALYNALVTEDGILNLTPERWSMTHLRQTPFKLKVDEQDRIYYAFNASLITYSD